MYKENLIQSLLAMSVLVLDAIQQKLELNEFVKQYNNFYYYEALDGHEAGREQKTVLQDLSPHVAFHHDVQTKVVNQLYIEERVPNEDIEAIGRIGEKKALQQLQIIGKTHGIEELIKALSDA